LYGCHNNAANPARADAYTGYWRNDAERLGRIITVREAAGIPGAAILRAAASGRIGHIVISAGNGKTVEAHSTSTGVINADLNGRRWDYGILVPWINNGQSQPFAFSGPDHTIYRYSQPMMVSSKIGLIQKALNSAGFDTNGVDNVFGLNTLKAVEAFQEANGLVVDGEVGRKTATALGLQQ